MIALCFHIIFSGQLPLSSFISLFFLPTDTKIILKEKYDTNITNYTNINLSDLSLLKIKNGKNITEICQNFLNDVNNQKEIHLINKFNLTVKIIVSILFVLTVLNIGYMIFLVKVGLCYDDDIGGYCQTCEQALSFNPDEEDDIGTKGFWIIPIFIVIFLGITFLCGFSLKFSFEIKDKMTLYCSFELGEDYDIDSWNVAKVFLYIIISLYSAEILVSDYTICFGIIQIIKERISKKNKNNQDKELI